MTYAEIKEKYSKRVIDTYHKHIGSHPGDMSGWACQVAVLNAIQEAYNTEHLAVSADNIDDLLKEM